MHFFGTVSVVLVSMLESPFGTADAPDNEKQKSRLGAGKHNINLLLDHQRNGGLDLGIKCFCSRARAPKVAEGEQNLLPVTGSPHPLWGLSHASKCRREMEISVYSGPVLPPWRTA